MNGIMAGIFRNHIMETHPTIDSDEVPPVHTLMVEASMKKKTQPVLRAIHDIIVARLGDNDIHSTMIASQGAKIHPALRLFPGSSLLMCTTNNDLDKGRGNGTVCKCVQVKLKSPDTLQWKNCEGRKVNSVSVDDIEWIKFGHSPGPPRGIPRFFKLRPKTLSSSVVKFPISRDCNDLTLSLGNVPITQFPVNTTIATTGHKLQGISKDKLLPVRTLDLCRSLESADTIRSISL